MFVNKRIYRIFLKIKRTNIAIVTRTCYALPKEAVPGLSWEKFYTLPHRKKINLYLSSCKHIEDIRYIIPYKYTEIKKHTLADNLYLVDSRIAADIAKRILPFIKDKNRMVCETNAGLGFITSELLDNGLDRIRLLTLKGFSNAYPGRVELFVKDFFHVWKMSYMDKMDKGQRVAQFLKGVPQREWSDEPVMTIIGTMSKLDFLKYLFKSMCFQNEIGTYGRIELFVLMRPGDYRKLTAGPHCDLHTYQHVSVFSGIFARLTIIENLKIDSPQTKSFKKYDIDKLYLVRIEFKNDVPLIGEELLPFYIYLKQVFYLVRIEFKNDVPLIGEELLPFYIYLKQVFMKGSILLIQKLEQWISGIGKEIILSSGRNEKLQNIDIFTKSGKLTPLELVEVFKIMYNHPDFVNSPLTAAIESELLKFETIESDIAEIHNKSNINSL
ncbi:hypothetical protein QE152_g33615 [Popillia japonica]|uniref:Dimethyladenosine transferase 2, mitochondrial n=1 Tax=Popillia japonica TaxID=7064 RepID=A0AAW1IW98_POPJA